MKGLAWTLYSWPGYWLAGILPLGMLRSGSKLILSLVNLLYKPLQRRFAPRISSSYPALTTTPGALDNDATVEVLNRAAVALAEAGAGVIAPSGMMDGAVVGLRTALDAAGLINTVLMPYSAKFNSVLYGPFKTSTSSQPGEPMHATHQMDVANGREARSKIRQDIAEGADVVIVKPAMTSLDVLALARREV